MNLRQEGSDFDGSIDKVDNRRLSSKTANLDLMSITEIVQLMNEDDVKIPQAIAKVLPDIERTIEVIIKAIKMGAVILRRSRDEWSYRFIRRSRVSTDVQYITRARTGGVSRWLRRSRSCCRRCRR